MTVGLKEVGDVSFEKLGLSPDWVRRIQTMQIDAPLPIQSEAAPILLSGRDVLMESETGSGKTLAYLLPILQRIDPSERSPQAVVLAPTRELSMQIFRVAEQLTKETDVRCMAVIGGTDIKRQMDKIKDKPHVLIGSIARLLDLSERSKLRSHSIRTIVFDEVDEMLDSEFVAKVPELLRIVAKQKQLVFVSATLGAKVLDVAAKWMENPAHIRGGAAHGPLPQSIDHVWIQTERRDKLDTLRRILRTYEPSGAIVFVNEKQTVHEVEDYLKFKGFAAVGLHGEGEKEDRKRAMDLFRTGKAPILVATDVAGRGLDVQGVSHVIHFDLPVDVKHYVHRVGRTGRAGAKGTSIAVVAERQAFIVEKFAKALSVQVAQKELFKGEAVDATTYVSPVKTGARTGVAAGQAPKEQGSRDGSPQGKPNRDPGNGLRGASGRIAGNAPRGGTDRTTGKEPRGAVVDAPARTGPKPHRKGQRRP